MRKVLLSALVCVSILVAGAALILAVRHSRSSAAQAGQKENGAEAVEKAPNVRVQTLEAATFEDRLILTGSVEPWEDVWLSAEVSGTIEWQGVEEGSPVTAGQELLKIDTEAIRVQLAQAHAQNKLAGQELEREKGLEKEGISSPQSLDRAVTERDVASANVRATEVQLERSVVVSPFDGVVDRLSNEEGEFVNRGDPLIRLVQMHKVKVNAGVPERDIPFFNKGDTVTVSVDALPGQGFSGTIFRIATTADAATRTFLTEVELDNAEGLLKPGMISRARFVRRRYPDAIAIPIFAVIPVDDRYIVYVEQNGVAQPRDVAVGIFQDNVVHIPQGLAPGDRLIVVGQRSVRAGEPVRVVEEAVE